MFTKKEKQKSIDDEISHILKELEFEPIESEKYKKGVVQLEVLCKARSYKKEPRWGIEPEALLMAGTNIAGILIVLNYEHLHVISSQAFNLISKFRGRI